MVRVIFNNASIILNIDIILSSDINECELNSSLCGQNSMCENTEGSFLCTCSAGFQLITETHQCQGCFLINQNNNNYIQLPVYTIYL